jgi:hypothetical protein
MSLLSLLKKIHHMSFSLVEKKNRHQIRNSHLLTVISVRWIISYSHLIIIDTWMVEIYSCRFFYLRTLSWSQPKQLLNNYFELKLLLLRPKRLFSFKTQIVSSLLTLQKLEVIAHVSESILVYGHTLTNCNILYSQYIS